MSDWHATRMLALDLETTGVDVESDRIVTAACAWIGGGNDTSIRSWLADPGVEIPAKATAVHGITTEHARAHGRPAKDIVAEILNELDRAAENRVPLVGHNLGTYDLTLLDREARRHLGVGVDGAFDLPALRVIDTRVLDQHVLPRRRRVSPTQGARQLITLAQVYGLGWDETAAHGAEYDALMAARAAWRIGQWAHTPHDQRPPWVQAERFQQFDQLAGLGLDTLHQRQTTWAAEQAADLEQYLRRTDPTVSKPRAWPLLPPGGDA